MGIRIPVLGFDQNAILSESVTGVTNVTEMVQPARNLQWRVLPALPPVAPVHLSHFVTQSTPLVMADDDVDLEALDDWEPEQLTHHEKWWVRQRPFLEQAGYVFRPRYQPGWEASWTAADGFFRDYEDGQFQPVSNACLY